MQNNVNGESTEHLAVVVATGSQIWSAGLYVQMHLNYSNVTHGE